MIRATKAQRVAVTMPSPEHSKDVVMAHKRAWLRQVTSNGNMSFESRCIKCQARFEDQSNHLRTHEGMDEQKW